MLQAILYDFDGTLVDSFGGIEVAARAAVRAAYPEWELPPLRPLIGPVLKDMLTIALPQASPAQVEELAQSFREYYDGGMCLECSLYAGVPEVLEALHAGKDAPRAFIVTNKRALPTHRLLKHFGIDGLFEGVICSDSPAPGFADKVEALAWTLRHYGLKAGSCLFVGDSRDDYLAAVAAGVPFVSVSYGYGAAVQYSREMPLESFDRLIALAQAHPQTK